MKKIVLIFALFMALGHVNLVAQIGATGPLITEYVAGAGADKVNYSFIEIYNGTGEDLFLEDYQLVMSPNGRYLTDIGGYAWGQNHLMGFAMPDPITGVPAEGAEDVVLAPGEIYLYVNDNAWKKLDSLLPNLPKTGVYVHNSDWIAHIRNWNGGGPAVTFVYLAEKNQALTPVDIVGVPEERNAGNEWGQGWGGLQKVFSRKSTITEPTAVFNSGEWNVSDVNTDDFDIALLAGIGFHPNPTPANVGGFERNTLSLNLYPNPANSRIYLESEISEEMNIRIFDIRGSLIMQRTIANNQGIDVSELAKGTYILNAVINNESINRKLFIK
jgi:hypothetical protein